jgi:ABC-type transport system involved in cytochrome bd biosynthesis fused ATPase/permease subunit
MENCNAYWDKDKNPEDQNPVLKEFNFKVKKGEKIAVIGKIGSGSKIF